MGEEAKLQPKEENTKAEEEEKKKEAAKTALPIVLFVDLHCVGCARKIHRSISKITGVERVVMDMGKNEVSIKGVVEPESVCTTIMKITKRRAKLLSPLLQPHEAQFVASQGSGLSTVELNVNMHCEACAGQLKRKILKMTGVRAVETELRSGKVTVTGTMDADRLVDYVYRRTRKQAKIVPQPEPEPEKPPEESTKPEEKKEEEKLAAPAAEEAKPEEKKEEKEPPPEEEKKVECAAATAEEGGETKKEGRSVEEQAMHKVMYYYQPLYVMERIAAPQIFSDENPNACCIV
ncbi:Heavy metal-associated isoprenylated plant protein 9 [Sesamum alatum]|uniref:Heavy metal-associated isoprenylated plant protein 9 n=1 Tax=Sesamum alatum TaxID=300844 RepID=A0AAE2CW05_9LAMI|nr:Heavy metal-associated isoprenylated plant protein 9 [Sesamum alatum]